VDRAAAGASLHELRDDTHVFASRPRRLGRMTMRNVRRDLFFACASCVRFCGRS
jgi:hypothetical protein